MKRILVALDASTRAGLVLEAAERLATLTGAKLVLYRAITVPPDLPHEVLAPGDGRVEDILAKDARGKLGEVAAKLPAGLVEDIMTAFASPWDGVCRAARERDADLIIIGSHGYGALDRVLGTTAAKIVNHADRNVLVVRNHL